ncbi:PREDICTED: uncharacterized protein C1orf115 homolog [Galeopterus variegatus]|uniref:Uncharacterized protein C1orf115 homolog n=1 Tax=Galeopterus variegatus TaxID=482537 RepID=A0ABM0QYF6_GALVR|nr:PREDICTED: uncharacterized protein C1orf115 homolog [Galeopterus variegatus]
MISWYYQREPLEVRKAPAQDAEFVSDHSRWDPMDCLYNRHPDVPAKNPWSHGPCRDSERDTPKSVSLPPIRTPCTSCSRDHVTTPSPAPSVICTIIISADLNAGKSSPHIPSLFITSQARLTTFRVLVVPGAFDVFAPLGRGRDARRGRSCRSAGPHGQGALRPGARRAHLAALPERYEPLEEPAPAERPARRHRQKLKKCGKNVGKVITKGCRYIFLGLQGFAAAYASPFGVATSMMSFVR